MHPKITASHDEPGPQVLDLDLRPWDTGDYLRRERFEAEDRENELFTSEMGIPSLDGGSSVPWEDIESSYQVTRIPGPLLSEEVVSLWRRIHVRIVLGLSPETDWERIVHATYYAVLDQGLGKKVAPGALIIGTLLAIAKAEGEPIRTHPRDLAKDLRVRYQILLKVRRIAAMQIEGLGLDLGRSIV